MNHESFTLELKGTLNFGSSENGFFFTLISPEITKIDEVFTKIDVGTSSLNDMVEICFIDVKVFYLPKEFPKNVKRDQITKFVIRRTGLREISNLHVFPNLKKLEISQNEVTVIERNSFIGNKILEEINLIGNQISYINEHSFNNLNKLTVLNLTLNQCINVNLHPRSDISNNLEKSLKKCSVNFFSEAQKSEILEMLRNYKTKNDFITNTEMENHKVEFKNFKTNQTQELENIKYYVGWETINKKDDKKSLKHKLMKVDEALGKKVDENYVENEIKNVQSSLSDQIESVRNAQLNRDEILKIEIDLRDKINNSESELQEKIKNLELKLKETLITLQPHPNINNTTLESTNSTQNSSNNLIIYIQLFIIAFFIILIIAGCIIFYVNRSNIVVMKGSYKLPDDAEINLSTELLCDADKNDEVKFQNVKKEIQKLPLQKPMSPVKPLTARLKPNLSIKMPECLTPKKAKLEVEAVLHSESPKIPPRMTFDDEIKNKLEKQIVDYDEIWNAETFDADYVEIQKKKDGDEKTASE